MTMRRALQCLALVALVRVSFPAAVAQTTAVDAMFQNPSHDFGTVARGAKLRHSFWLVNTSSSDVRIISWQAKCGCTEVKPGARTSPGTQTPIEVTLDTQRFDGEKKSGLILQLQVGNYFVTKDLNLRCFIRSDIMLTPGMADFNLVPRGTTPTVAMTLSYLGGNPSWRIVDAKTLTDSVVAEISAPVALQGGGIQYQITARLNPKAPAGYLKDEISLITRDSANTAQVNSIPISVVANIQPAVTVSPGNLVLGRVKAGETVTKVVIVRTSDRKPFKITGTNSTKPDLSAGKPANDAEAPVQQLTITLKAPNEPGAYNAVLEISTNVKDEPPAKLTAYATVVR